MMYKGFAPNYLREKFSGVSQKTQTHFEELGCQYRLYSGAALWILFPVTLGLQ